MLFVLTGEIQTGKTRWLERLVQTLDDRGAVAYGVLAPGEWVSRHEAPERYPHADANGYEKLGINNVLLPSGERIAFARRLDLAKQEGGFDEQSQSNRAKLAWSIDDTAIERVNAHFAELREAGVPCDGQAPCLLVVDELGRLELERGEGLVQAVGSLDDGPKGPLKHALIVVRASLLPAIEGRFSAWGEKRFIEPEPRSFDEVVATVTGATCGQAR